MSSNGIGELCRICLGTSHQYSNIYVEKSLDSNPIYESINFVCDVQICVDDGLPECVCQKCLSVVKEFKAFKTNAQRARAELLLMKLNSIETEEIKTEEISIEDQSPCISDGVDPKDESEGTSLTHSGGDFKESNCQQDHIKEEALSDAASDDEDYNAILPDGRPQPQELIKKERQNDDPLEDEEDISIVYNGILQPQVCIKQEHMNDRTQVNVEYNTILHNGRLQPEVHRKQNQNEGVLEDGEYNTIFHNGRAQNCNGSVFGNRKATRRYECSYCHRPFGKKCHVDAHEMIHTGQKPFACLQCGRSFRERGALKKHMVTHLRHIRHQCPECSMDFGDVTLLEAHLHHHKERAAIWGGGGRPHQCDECGKIFGKKCHLDSHRLIHSGERPFECVLCRRRFREKGALNKHLVRHRKEVE